jgi:hypothetical protein
LQNRGCAVALRQGLTVLPHADFSHSADFKRVFEADAKRASPRSGRILLDLACRNAYKLVTEKVGHAKVRPVQTVVAKPLILVVRRTAVGG